MAAKELTVCDITGEWGLYQWSVTLFATLYSAILGVTVVVGPLWTPEMRHICLSNAQNDSSGLIMQQSGLSFAGNPHECFVNPTGENLLGNLQQATECTTFFYDDSKLGIMLTNTFDLVCSREWLRSAVSSASLVGMLLSSVSLGLLSDQYGRMSCIRTGFVISIASTILAVLSHNYLLLNISIMLMSFAQVGVANALCTLVMEATSPKYRFVPVFEYGFGWALGMLSAPFLNDLTKNYKHFLLILLGVQLLMSLWLKYGVFESIRWLLSEGMINQAQIELRKCCRFNRIANGAELAQKIADVQTNQLRKASSVIGERMAPLRLAKATQQEISATSQELSVLNTAIRKSFSIEAGQKAVCTDAERGQPDSLAGNQMSLTISSDLEQQQQLDDRQMIERMIDCGSAARNSITTQGLIQLALKYSKKVQEQEEGSFFLVQMFHRKLWKTTLILMLLSLMLETSYYGLIQANKFVGKDVNLNYIAGAFGEWIAAIIYMLLLWLFNRRLALILPTLLSSLACFTIALLYYLIPNKNTPENVELGLTGANVTFQSISFLHSLVGLENQEHLTQTDMLEYRENVNFYVMLLGKLAITVGIQVSATIIMEVYPNNLRQTGSGAVVMVGRIGSILAPFLFNDSSEDKNVFKLTLVGMAAIGTTVSLLVPCMVRDTTGMELCDRLNDIEEED